MTAVDLGDLGLDRGGHLLLQRALSRAPVGGSIVVLGRDPALPVHLRTWARAHGHDFDPDTHTLTRGSARDGRWRDASRAGSSGLDGVAEHADARWGLAARGALVEAGICERVGDRIRALGDLETLVERVESLRSRFEVLRREDERRLRAITEYANETGCRSQMLRRYFGPDDAAAYLACHEPMSTRVA